MLQHILIYFKFFFHFEEIHRIAFAGSQRTKDEKIPYRTPNTKASTVTCLEFFGTVGGHLIKDCIFEEP